MREQTTALPHTVDFTWASGVAYLMPVVRRRLGKGRSLHRLLIVPGVVVRMFGRLHNIKQGCVGEQGRQQ